MNSVSDFRLLTSKLEEENLQYTTNQVRQVKDLIVVLRGVIESLSEENIRLELERKKFPIKSVYRMRNGDKIWQLVAVHLDAKSPAARSIFDLEVLGGPNIKVEVKRKSKNIPQCRRCQQF